MDDININTLEDWFTEDRVNAAIALALNVAYAIAIIMVALFVAGWVKTRIVNVAQRHPKLDPTLFGFVANLGKYLILVFAATFVLNRFGIQTTSLVALIGAAGLAIGLALQGTLTNLAAGVMIVMFRPFRVGDAITAAGQSGTVQEISLFFTELKTYDGVQVILPNGDVWAKAITNYSVNPIRMIDLTVGVSYNSDLKAASRTLTRVATSDPRVLADPEPFVKVKELGGSSVDFVFRVWVKRADWWVTKCEMTEQIKLELDAAGVEIPFPTQTLIMDTGTAEALTAR